MKQHLKKENYHILEIPHKIAKEFIEKYHYSQSCSNTSSQRFGLFSRENDILIGVALFMIALWSG